MTDEGTCFTATFGFLPGEASDNAEGVELLSNFLSDLRFLPELPKFITTEFLVPITKRISFGFRSFFNGAIGGVDLRCCTLAL